MKAKEATAEDLEADGSCQPEQLFAANPPAGTASSSGTASSTGTASSGGTASTSEGSRSSRE